MTKSLAELAAQACQPLRGVVHQLPEAEVVKHLNLLPNWTLERGQIVKRFEFRNYYETMAFVNAVAYVAHQQDHHPDLQVSYNRCEVRYNTHDVGGLSINDFVCAAKIECLLLAGR
ncbi:4a-hydroxytetrahydrobiopterin dehydratase [Ahniella affigens]|uniref:Putative pterin-4-alpha-carbinolamine dehydratase n=1 Tax=Ahniella affigens TaxID=2021234 RepID=A0A2P1PTD1_9GAMM|nr:4a-hydroxytetrahydrobiopterin dehydratase [Ahniella affigens]AVP98082.1 4a-hydroxytetrahydrobiopterin dehydratase [Ahniella affigens]